MIKTATGNKDQYQFLTFINVNGEVEIWETDNLVDLDKQVEKMLNGNYRKSDILLVSPLSFDVFADVYDNSKYPRKQIACGGKNTETKIIEEKSFNLIKNYVK